MTRASSRRCSTSPYSLGLRIWTLRRSSSSYSVWTRSISTFHRISRQSRRSRSGSLILAKSRLSCSDPWTQVKRMTVTATISQFRRSYLSRFCSKIVQRRACMMNGRSRINIHGQHRTINRSKRRPSCRSQLISLKLPIIRGSQVRALIGSIRILRRFLRLILALTRGSAAVIQDIHQMTRKSRQAEENITQKAKLNKMLN